MDVSFWYELKSGCQKFQLACLTGCLWAIRNKNSQQQHFFYTGSQKYYIQGYYTTIYYKNILNTPM